MGTKTWNGSQSEDFETPANWTPSNGANNNEPEAGDDLVFDNTSDGGQVNCVLGNAGNYTTEILGNITIASNYTGKLTTNNTIHIRLSGALTINRADCLKFDGTNTVTFSGDPASVGIATYDGAGTAYTKALVSFGADTSVWNTGRGNTAFIFPSHSFSMVDGVYPKFTFTGTLKAKKIYSDASRTEFNNYGSVDIGDMNANDVNSSSYDIYDYSKEFLFEGTLTAIGDTFRFGHTTVRFKTSKSSSYGKLDFPVTGSSHFLDSTTKNFYAQYHKLVIETNDIIDNYWLIPAGLTIECNELVIKDGGRIYGEVGVDVKAATIKCVKRPTIRGDWNFRQIADGVYETIGAISNTPVYHGGTGLQTIPVGAILYGNGNGTISVLNPGSNGQVLKLVSGVPSWENA